MKNYLEYLKGGNTIEERYIASLKNFPTNNNDSTELKLYGSLVKNGEFILGDKILEGIRFVGTELKNYINVNNGIKKNPIKNNKKPSNTFNNSASLGISLAIAGYKPNPVKDDKSISNINSSYIFLSP